MTLDPRTETRIRLLADGTNLAVLAALDDADESLHVRTLAERLVEDEVEVVRAAEYEQRIEETVVSLHHDRLPRLAEADLLEYDPRTNEVEARGADQPTTAWEDGQLTDAALEYLQRSRALTEEFVLLQDRESVVRQGRTFAAEAEEELFCLYESPVLLQEECVTRVQRALDRGVRLYVGSRDPAVRDLARDLLPEATVWEPQTDWLNDSSLPRIGRLVLADRRKVMLAVLDGEPTDATNPDEAAIVGEGPSHPLVVLVRDLLGSRLDHLDYQSEEFTGQLPS